MKPCEHHIGCPYSRWKVCFQCDAPVKKRKKKDIPRKCVIDHIEYYCIYQQERTQVTSENRDKLPCYIEEQAKKEPKKINAPVTCCSDELPINPPKIKKKRNGKRIVSEGSGPAQEKPHQSKVSHNADSGPVRFPVVTVGGVAVDWNISAKKRNRRKRNCSDAKLSRNKRTGDTKPSI